MTPLFMIMAGFVIGLLFGSFANVLIHRIPRDENVAWPASHCPHCQHPLAWYHNIPLLSYLFLKGECHFCHHGISLRYPIVEFFSGLIGALIFALGLPMITATLYTLAFITLLALSFIDWETKMIPDSLNLLALTLAIFASLDLSAIVAHARDALLFAGGFSLLRFYLSYALKKEAMGEGDIMIAATIGAVLGPLMGGIAIFLSAFLALPFSLYFQRRDDVALPFVPFLAAALFLVFVNASWLYPFLKDFYHL